MYRDILRYFILLKYVDRNILYRKSQVASVRSWPMCKQLARGRLLPTRHFLIDHLATWSPSKLTLRTAFHVTLSSIEVSSHVFRRFFPFVFFITRISRRHKIFREIWRLFSLKIQGSCENIKIATRSLHFKRPFPTFIYFLVITPSILIREFSPIWLINFHQFQIRLISQRHTILCFSHIPFQNKYRGILYIMYDTKIIFNYSINFLNY